MASTLRPTLIALALASLAAAVGACSAGPNLDTFEPDLSSGGSQNGAGGSLIEGPRSGGASSSSGGSGTSTGSGGGPQVICTPAACTDTPRVSESCADAKAWGFCGQEWFQECKQTCGTCDGSEEEVCVEVPDTGSGGSNSGGGDDVAVTPLPSGSPHGWASRYWDCCKQHCSWPENAPHGAAISCNRQDQNISDGSTQSACSGGGSAHTCWSMAPWAVADNLAYGYAAVPPGGACGKCYQLQFNGQGHHEANDPGSKSLAGKTMIVQATNIGHDVNGGQFDLLIPGGGVGAFNGCTSQWGVSDLGAQYGGFLTGCNGSVSCLRNKCNSVFAGKSDLLEGCLFHADWMGGANNPEFNYAEVACPAALEQTSGMSD